MKILGIETSCDETAISVIEADGSHIKVLSNVISSQIETHARFGGVVPSLAAREHAANIGPVFESSLKEAGITDPASEIDLIAITNGPGLGPALLVGLMFARTLAWRWDKPIIGVNHMDGHVHSNWLSHDIGNDAFPVLNLIVSGGHTELVLMRSHTDYEILGETQDDAVGEAFDKVARLLDLGYPGGPRISKLSLEGDPAKYDLPRPMLKSGNLDFSYSGLKTAVLYLIRDITEGTRELAEQEKKDIAASFQEAAIDVLIQKTRQAAEKYRPKTIMLSGGVSANALLRERLSALAGQLGITCFIPEMKYTTDNAAMIAAAGYFRYAAEGCEPMSAWQDISMDANMRLGV